MALIQPPAKGIKLLLLLVVAGVGLSLRWMHETRQDILQHFGGIVFALSAISSMFRLAARKPYRSAGYDAGGGASAVLMACALFEPNFNLKLPFLAGAMILVVCTLTGLMEKWFDTSAAPPQSPPPELAP